MKLNTLLAGAAVAVIASLAAASANADTLTLALPDIGTFEGYTAGNVGQTYSGNGFVGLYNDNQFGHLFGLEGQYSKTVAEADISALAGLNIVSATFSFDLLEAYNLGTTTTVSGYAGTGALGYLFAAPGADFGTASTALVSGTNTVDVTGIVAAAAAAGQGNLNLFFENSDNSDWTYTYPGYGYDLDRAHARLTVEYSPGVPEPASWALMLTGFLGAGAALRSRRRTAVAATA
jgi:hypothetical protein